MLYQQNIGKLFCFRENPSGGQVTFMYVGIMLLVKETFYL